MTKNWPDSYRKRNVKNVEQVIVESENKHKKEP